MRPRTYVAVAVVVLLVGGLGVAGLVATQSPDRSLTVRWVSDTARESGGNHHAATGARVDEGSMVFAPVSGAADTPTCALVGLDGETGETRWRHPIPTQNCTVHSVADPTVADVDGDGVAEVLAATTERVVWAFEPLSGAVDFRANLSAYGYTRPVVADLVGDDRSEVIVVDVKGTVTVLDGSGTVRWRRSLDAYTWGQPAVADFDDDGAPEIAVGLGSGELVLLERDGDRAWAAPTTFDSSITWMATGDGDGDGVVEIVVATATGGQVAMVDGATGDREWTRDLGAYAAVNAVGDGDGDGTTEVYAVARDGVLTALSGATGETEWQTTLTTAAVQMMPPPVRGDVDGDGAAELVAATNDGMVLVLAPDTGRVLARYERSGTIYTHPRLFDLDGDGDLEVVVMYAHGQVVALDVPK